LLLSLSLIVSFEFVKIDLLFMKLTLDITEESKIPFFMELVKSFDYIKIVNEQKALKKAAFKAELREGLRQSFKEMRLHEEGKIKLKTAREALNEL
jgi:hypothetical protein